MTAIGAAADPVAAPAAAPAPDPERVSSAKAEWRKDDAAPRSVGAGIEEQRFEFGTGMERIALHRYRKTGADASLVVLYLPGTNMNGVAALTDEQHNFWLYLAARGITVYALDYRSHFVAPDAGDFAALAAWTTDVYVADAVQALALVRTQSPRAKVFVAGFSRGVTLAYGLACAAPGGLAGLIALDGGFKRPPGAPAFGPGPVADEPYAASRARFLAAGRFADDVGAGIGWDVRQALMHAAAGGDPDAQARLTQVLTNAWGSGRLANPGPISDVRVLATLMADYDRFYPSAQNVDGAAIAGVANAPHTPVDDCWGQMALPILYVESGKFGAALGLVSYSATHSGSKDVTGIQLPGFGHLDVLVAEQAPRLVYEPTLQWLLAH